MGERPSSPRCRASGRVDAMPCQTPTGSKAVGRMLRDWILNKRRRQNPSMEVGRSFINAYAKV